MVHIGMRVRITTQVLPPWAVQDATGTVMEIQASAEDQRSYSGSSDVHPAEEVFLKQFNIVDQHSGYEKHHRQSFDKRFESHRGTV